MNTTQHHATTKPRFTRTLAFRLLVVFIALSSAFVLIIDAAFTGFSYRTAMSDMDSGLTDSAHNVVDRYINTVIFSEEKTPHAHDLLSPSDHYVHIHFYTNPFPPPPALDISTDPATSSSVSDTGTHPFSNISTPHATTTTSTYIATTAHASSSLLSAARSLPYSDDEDDDDSEDDSDDDDNDTDDDHTPTATHPNENNAPQGNTNTGNDIPSLVNPSPVPPEAHKPPENTIVIEEGYLIYTQEPQTAICDAYGLPIIDDTDYATLASMNTPRTIQGTKGSQWRAVSVPITGKNHNDVIGHVVMARPLSPVIDSVTHTALFLGVLGMAIVTLGSAAAFFFIKRSLRPLKQIEDTTHSIADGDLTQRVPPGPPGSEVGMLSDSINTMLTQIEQSFNAKEQSQARMRQFVSDASHELRTPLATVRGYAELYRLGGVSKNDTAHAMERIESEATRMGVLVNDLLQLARLDEGRPLTIETVDVSAIAQNALSDFHVRRRERDVRLISLNGSAVSPALIRGDKDKVTQVIANLLSNIDTHTPAASPVEIAIGTVDASSAAPLPSSAHGNTNAMPLSGEQVVVEVRDHGPGINEAERGKIFERFFRTDSSRSRDSGGSGLGLSIVASLMQAHNGYAEARETNGGGLTIRLVFPSAAKDTVPASA